MQEPRPLDEDPSDSTGALRRLRNRNARPPIRRQGVARKLLLVLTVAALCLGVALYFGASRTSAEREPGQHAISGPGPNQSRQRQESEGGLGLSHGRA